MKKTNLHADACMISKFELIHIMSTDAVGKISLNGLLARHARAIANITDAEIDVYICALRGEAGILAREKLSANESKRYTKLSLSLKALRDQCARTVLVR